MILYTLVDILYLLTALAWCTALVSLVCATRLTGDRARQCAVVLSSAALALAIVLSLLLGAESLVNFTLTLFSWH